MGPITIIAYIVLMIALLFFAYLNVKYFISMWEYKRRKKGESEDKLYKSFD